MTSLVLGCDLRVRDYQRWWHVVSGAREQLARAGVRHLVVYRAADDGRRIFTTIGLHSREPVDRLMAAPEILTWFDMAGIDDIPPVFVGTLVQKLRYLEGSGDGTDWATGEIVASIFRAADYGKYLDRVHASRQQFVDVGMRQFWIYRALDDAAEIMSLQEIDSHRHAQAWLDYQAAVGDFYREAGVGVYPPIFVGTLGEVIQIDGG